MTSVAPTTSPATTAPPTTAAPTTPATAAPTTAATVPSTTAAQETTTSSTVSTVPSTTLNTAAASSSGSGTSPWVWVIVGLAALALVGGLILLLRNRNRRNALQSWRAASRPSVDAAHLALDLIPDTPGGMMTREELQSVRGPVEQAADGLDRTSAEAPVEEGRAAALRASGALRGLVFALEAGLILRESSTPPTGDQLAKADAASRARRAESESALGELDRLVTDPAPPSAAAPAASG